MLTSLVGSEQFEAGHLLDRCCTWRKAGTDQELQCRDLYLAEMIGRRCHHDHGEAFWILVRVDDDGCVVEHGLPEGVEDPAVRSLHPGESLDLLETLEQNYLFIVRLLVDRKCRPASAPPWNW